MIERELGRGGMATVYLARDAKHNRSVAIKVLRPELADLLGRERFLREIEIAAGLQHPNIVPLYDSGSDGDLLYYVMPLIQGESLRDRLDREKQLSFEEMFGIVRAVAAALAHAHERGLIHRDIKPANILLSGGQAFVADFGIGRAISAAGGAQLTERGIAVGTPAYMSPEQASGHDAVDVRSDVYSLGCVVYEMLAGEPPFSGRTAQAIIARHLQDRPPSLKVVRPTVTAALQRVIETALAKVPADRYATAQQFVEALDAARTGRADWRRRVRWVAGAMALFAAAAALWWFVIRPTSPLDQNKVVVFPLDDRKGQGAPAGSGYEVALMIEAALEHTEPLRWIDGWSLVDPVEHNDAAVVARVQRRIALDRGARWYIGGAVARLGDSATVVLRITDAGGDSLVSQASASRPAAQVAEAALDALNKLLPPILAPGQRIDLMALSERRSAAVATWLQGEREYRRGNFDTALAYLRRAVDLDSALAVAALRAAQAASWKSLLPEAARSVGLALAHVGMLPVRQADLARGLAAYLEDRPDSAVRWLTRALATTPDWAEAHMALGEVYHHLLPQVAEPLDSLAESEFEAAAVDTGFAPPLFHLAETAIRRGEFDRAAAAVRRFERLGGGAEERSELDLMLRCSQHGRSAVDWGSVARASPSVVLGAAKMLSVAGAYPGCAEDASRALLTIRTASPYQWGAVQVLQGLLAARGDSTAIIALVDSMQLAGLWWAATAYLVDALAGTPGVATKVEQTVGSLRHLYGPLYEDSLDSGRLLLLATWYVEAGRNGDAARLDKRLRSLSARSQAPADELYAEALTAHLLLSRGDTAAALNRFERLEPSAPRDLLVWGYAESLPAERLRQAELLFARGRYQEVIRVAAGFDHPTPVVYLPFLPRSLALRYRAALAQSRPSDAARYRNRLVALGRNDLLPGRN